jgi:hypothetical protein
MASITLPVLAVLVVLAVGVITFLRVAPMVAPVKVLAAQAKALQPKNLVRPLVLYMLVGVAVGMAPEALAVEAQVPPAAQPIQEVVQAVTLGVAVEAPASASFVTTVPHEEDCMNDFAMIENGIVSNVIVGPLPDGMEGIPLFDRPVAIGDAYTDGVFLRDGELVLTDAERIATLEARVAELEAK